mgnify:CR=1 FL=1
MSTRRDKCDMVPNDLIYMFMFENVVVTLIFPIDVDIIHCDNNSSNGHSHKHYSVSVLGVHCYDINHLFVWTIETINGKHNSFKWTLNLKEENPQCQALQCSQVCMYVCMYVNLRSSFYIRLDNIFYTYIDKQ